MTPQVQQIYKELYDKAKSLPNSDALGIMPMTFVGPKSHFRKELPMFIGRESNGLGGGKLSRAQDDYDYDELADILAVRIREYKKINEENSIEMAKAVIDEVATTLKLNESDDKGIL